MFKAYRQWDGSDCGPTCLKMILKHYGKTIPIQYLREKCYTSADGTSLLNISEAAEFIGLRTLSARLPFVNLSKQAPLPLIAHFGKNHFVVVYKITKFYVHIADPAMGKIKYSHNEFKKKWCHASSEDIGVALMFEVSPKFSGFRYDNLKHREKKLGDFKSIIGYLSPHKKLILHIFFALLIGTIFQLIIPFLTQSLVDKGINGQNIDFVILVLIAQLVLHISSSFSGLIRSWLYLHFGTKINIALISDFLSKLLKLQYRFFSKRSVGDIIQRIGDHKRIESFITGPLLNMVFTAFNLIIFGFILNSYNRKIFVVFFIGSILYILWTVLFFKVRRKLDFDIFFLKSLEKNKLIEIIQGIQEIKLFNNEIVRRWEWERIQARLFKSKTTMLIISQIQSTVAMLILQIMKLSISYIVAKSVIEGLMTFGMMIAVQYIVGQLSRPVRDIVKFFTSAQIAKISLERLNQVYSERNELDDLKKQVSILPSEKSIHLKDLTFQFFGPKSPKILNNLNIIIPEGKTTAIVGESGSGKTTLFKLLLKLYFPSNGNVNIGNISLKNVSTKWWREQSCSVLQDSFIFQDTIANNISLNDEALDKEKLYFAAEVANIRTFIESMHFGYDTVLGSNGQGVSQGQKQRILIARAVYKNPQFLFLDEATSFLDSNTEQIVMKNLKKFFIGKTVLISAHRLSTIKDADQIIVLNKGSIMETGTHQELLDKKKLYYKLVRNQLVR